jgi:hypothetical protein
MRKHRSTLGGAAALALVMTLAMAGCKDDNPPADPSPTTSTSATSSPTESTTPTTEPETPEQKATRLATEQAKAYFKTYFRLYAHPELPLDILDRYANTQALLDAKSALQERRDSGERWVGKPKVTKAWLGTEKVVFNEQAPMAVVDLYICYDLNGSHRVDAQGNVTEIKPQVAQARYAIYAQDWPNESPSDWRVGKEFTSGEPCAE